MRIIVTGSHGRLGAALCRHLRERHEVISLDRKAMDLSSPDSVREALQSRDFDVIINCAALTDVDYCETHEAQAMRINSEAVHELAGIAASRRARLIQISTDYVFDGRKRKPYVEEDTPLPLSRYGRSKLAGEAAALRSAAANLVVRVSWVFGPDRPSFIDAILSRAMGSDRVEAIVDKYSAPSLSSDLSQYIELLVHCDAPGGVVHLCNQGGCSWQEYAQHALDCAAAAGVALRARRVGAIRLDQMPKFIAKRPAYTVMATDRFTKLTGVLPRDWREAVSDYVRTCVVPRLSL